MIVVLPPTPALIISGLNFEWMRDEAGRAGTGEELLR
jgi:hypothetical protein